MIDALSEHIITLKKDHDRLLSALKDMSEAEMERGEYQNTLATLKKQVDIYHKHLSIFKLDNISDRENKHRPDMESKLT